LNTADNAMLQYIVHNWQCSARVSVMGILIAKNDNEKYFKNKLGRRDTDSCRPTVGFLASFQRRNWVSEKDVEIL